MLEKYSNIVFHENLPSVGIDLFCADGQTEEEREREREKGRGRERDLKKLIIVFDNFADASINFISLNKMKKNKIILTTESAVQQILARAINPKIMKIRRNRPVCTLLKM